MDTTVRGERMEPRVAVAAPPETAHVTLGTWPMALGMVLVVTADLDGEIYTRIECRDVHDSRFTNHD